eukprot:3803081-Amphidinium_carterae.3
MHFPNKDLEVHVLIGLGQINEKGSRSFATGPSAFVEHPGDHPRNIARLATVPDLGIQPVRGLPRRKAGQPKFRPEAHCRRNQLDWAGSARGFGQQDRFNLPCLG